MGGVKKTTCIWRLRAAYAARHSGGVELALDGKEMDLKMLSGSQARPTMAMIESYLTLIQDLPSGDDGQNPSAQAKNNLAQALT
jgi:hypothetical protein